jgi:hypothetical protein
MLRPACVGARRCLARRASRRGILRGMHRPPRRPTHHHAHRLTTGFPALRAGRVRHRLTPTGRRAHRRTVACMRPTGDARPTCVGARQRLARRASRRGNIRAGNHPGGDCARHRGHPVAPPVPVLPGRRVRRRRRENPPTLEGRGAASRAAPRWRGKWDGTYRTTRISAPRSRRIIVFPAAFSGSPRGR